ncbi:MAG TPA: hypothetical protein VFZ97_06780 [Acidimicrobiales bacterium]
MPDAHPIQRFLSELSDFREYPPDVTPVPEQLPGTAAFAASAGVFRPPKSTKLPPFPYEGLMVIGHNIDSIDNYEIRRQSGLSHGDRVPGYRTMSTWVGLYRLLDLAGVPLNRFFFSNVYVGLKKGRPTGRFTSHSAPIYREFCRDFLGQQVTEMQPSVVLVLGEPAWSELCSVMDTPPWPAGRLPRPAVARVTLYGHQTLIVAGHHTAIPKRIAADGAAVRSAWNG